MKKDYKREAIKLLKANRWTDDMIGKAFGVPEREFIKTESINKGTGDDKENFRQRMMDDLPPELKEQVDYLSTYRKRSKSVINEKVGVIRRLRNEFSFSFPEIGLLLRRNHATIMHHYKLSFEY